jgi:hypothetical protein
MYVEGSELRFIGTPHDVEMGMYLCELIVGAGKRSWSEYGESLEGFSYNQIMAKRESFYVAMGQRLNAMLHQLAGERAEARQASHGASSGTALVVVKSDLIRAKMEEMGLKLYKGKKESRKFGVDRDAFEAGNRAGSRVNLNRPVEGTDSFGELA